MLYQGPILSSVQTVLTTAVPLPPSDRAVTRGRSPAGVSALNHCWCPARVVASVASKLIRPVFGCVMVAKRRAEPAPNGATVLT